MAAKKKKRRTTLSVNPRTYSVIASVAHHEGVPLGHVIERLLTKAERQYPPSAQQVLALRGQAVREVGCRGRDANGTYARRISVRFAELLRERGWLAEEGYAEGSWAAPAAKEAA